MNIIEQVTPGIRLIFERVGWRATVVQQGREIKVTLSKEGVPDETRNFPIPSKNSDLSVGLLAWRDEL